ncbi:Protein kinase, ATP binding site-containing protein [Cynara cardunculus var. scolymus]|uniref:mitogen-activated protein kinase kinase kinase n=1 Tax=Cynara cardunculus var. scolymus TaxID=59895 RepID=A0A118JVY8_CYNCS|nr:Protein kinase, ATP binding site-containing protein [Cynara cardunculus var. scolymus]
MYTRQKRLERRNATKNVDYDASISSFDGGSPHTTRLLDISLLSHRTSYRLQGINGEFDLICRSIGLSGPEDFAIPAAEVSSPTSCHYLHRFRFRDPSQNETQGSLESGLSEIFGSRIRINDDKAERRTECSRLLEADEARVLGRDTVVKRADDVNGCGINKVKHIVESSESTNYVCLANVEKSTVLDDDSLSRARENCYVEGQSGIKGIRPPLQLVADNLSLSWELIRGFATEDDENSALDGPVGASNEDTHIAVDERIVIVKEEEPSERITLRNDAILSPCSSNTSSSATELEYSVSPKGPLKNNTRNWQKGDFLGRGSYGTVYEGYNEHGFFFAVKEVSLLDEGSKGKQSIVQLEQEISLLSQFQHENIVRYLGSDTMVFQDDGKLYIFLELVTKGSLANLYRKYHLGDSQVSAYTKQILSGLNYLHERNVVHRDIKCANILVDVSGSVKLADFGLAKATKLNDIKSCKGTPYWMAPEVVNRLNNGYGLAADIWSLGCTVLEMLTRKIPYSHLEGLQALFRIGRGEAPPVPDTLSVESQDFIRKCLQVNQNDRPTAAQLLMHPFVKREHL